MLQHLLDTYYDIEGVGESAQLPVFSCKELLTRKPGTPSGEYWIFGTDGKASLQYCDMTRSCGGVDGGWMRVAALDMTDSNQQCPDSLTERGTSQRYCEIGLSENGCSEVHYPVESAIGYFRVCGRVIGFQQGTTDSFLDYNRPANPSIDSYYVDGVSITRGSPRKHIWTFASALDEAPGHAEADCACINPSLASHTHPPPEYVGDHYFCDTGSRDGVIHGSTYTSDPLWDGAGCEGENECCSFNSPPWFYRDLLECNSDDLEVRVCRDESRGNEDIGVQVIEIYVQ